jgi:hypothetical protein
MPCKEWSRKIAHARLLLLLMLPMLVLLLLKVHLLRRPQSILRTAPRWSLKVRLFYRTHLLLLLQ